MASNIPYNGVPDVAPQTQAPDDYQNIRPTAAEGLQQLGAGASKAGQFFGQVAADNAFNGFQSAASKLLYGDPSKPGADGQPGTDTGFMGMKGAAALYARPHVEQQLDQLLQDTRNNLGTPEQQAQFDTYSRHYRTQLSGDIGNHTDQQATSWYGQVNSDSVNVATDRVSNDPLNGQTVASAAADATNALLKQAQLQGADLSNPNDPLVQNAKITARRTILHAQVLAVGATDPAKALSILSKNRNIAGADYEPLYEQFSEKADRQVGEQFGTDHFAQHAAAATQAYNSSYANPAQPIYQEASTSIAGGMSPQGLARTVQIESGGRADVINASGHKGLGQFSDATWAAFGGGGNPLDPHDAIMAIQRYAANNAKYLTGALGRPPTDAELYLAHQQGPVGAARLLANPNAPAASIVGLAAVTGNGGSANMTAGQYAAMWTHKFNGTAPNTGIQSPAIAAGDSRADVQTASASPGQIAAPGAAPSANDAVDTGPAAPGVPNGAGAYDLPGHGADTAPAGAGVPTVQPALSPKASAYQAVEDSNLTPRQKQYAINAINQQASAAQIAADATATQQRQNNEQAMNTYTSQILQGNYPDTAKVANDPMLTAEGKDAITNLMLRHANDSPAAATAAYGSGYWKTYNQVLAQPGDASRISDPVTIYKLAGPGGPLTGAGAANLVDIMSKVSKSADDAAVHTTAAGLLNYAKSKISFDETGLPSIPGVPQHQDAEGERLFNSRFLPTFEAQFNKAIQSGDPWKFLTQETVDKMIAGIRSPREMALKKIEANAGVDATQMALAAAPQGVDPEGWQAVLAVPAMSPKGRPWAPANWAEAVRRLQQNPTPEVIKQFDASFGSSPISASQILDVLRPAGMSDAVAAANRQANAGAFKANEAQAPLVAAPAPAAAAPVVAAGLVPAAAPAAVAAPAAPAQSPAERAAAERAAADNASHFERLSQKAAKDGELSPADAKTYWELKAAVQAAPAPAAAAAPGQAPVAPPGYFTVRTNHGWEIEKLPPAKADAANTLDAIAARAGDQGLSDADAAAYWKQKNAQK